MNKTMDTQELENFNIELRALLLKYDVSMGVIQQIQITKNKKVVEPEIISGEATPDDSVEKA